MVTTSSPAIPQRRLRRAIEERESGIGFGSSAPSLPLTLLGRTLRLAACLVRVADFLTPEAPRPIGRSTEDLNCHAHTNDSQHLSDSRSCYCPELCIRGDGCRSPPEYASAGSGHSDFRECGGSFAGFADVSY